MSARLLDHTSARIDQHDCQVNVGCTSNHVACVLNVAWAVGNDERTLWRCKIAIGNINGDALLALGPQAVGKQRKVDVVVAAALAYRFDVL